MNLREAVASAGGIVRVAELRDHGYPQWSIEGAVAAGWLMRPRNGWVAAPGADPHLIAAARAGGVLTCVTQARRLGLAVHGEHGTHIAGRAHTRVRGVDEVTRIHWARPVVPRHPHLLEDHIENVLVLLASCLPPEEALGIWESALRRDPFVRDELARVPLPAPARALLELSSPDPDSGLHGVAQGRHRAE